MGSTAELGGPSFHLAAYIHALLSRSIILSRLCPLFAAHPSPLMNSLQHPLGTPREQKAQTRVSSFGFMCVYDSGDGGERPEHWTHWGSHYEEVRFAAPSALFRPFGDFSVPTFAWSVGCVEKTRSLSRGTNHFC